VPGGKDAGIPGKTQIRQGIQRPEGFAGDGVTGGPVAGDRLLGLVFQNLLGAGGLFPEDF
jgi:hypothetical protein